MLRMLRRVLVTVLPCERGPAPLPPNDGTVPIAAGTPPATSTEAPPATSPAGSPPATTDDSAALRQQLEDVNRRLQEREALDEGRINQLAEERLFQLLPELPGEIEAENRRRAEAARRPPDGDRGGTTDEPPNEEDRIARLEDAHERLQADRDAEIILAEIEGYRKTMPYVDVPQVLTILARAGDRDVNLQRLCEVSHKAKVSELERYHQDKLADKDYMRSLVAKHAETAPLPPPVPSQNGNAGAPTTTPAITSKNAKDVFAQRLQQAGWGKSEVGPPRP